MYKWAYDLAPEIANCKDVSPTLVPPLEINPPRYLQEYGRVLLRGSFFNELVKKDWLVTDPFDSLDDFWKFFRRGRFPRPSVLPRYPVAGNVVINDRDFAAQRLAGANPLMLRRVTFQELRPIFGGEGFIALINAVSPIANLNQLSQANGLYLADYAILAQGMNGKKYMPAPLALFGVINGELRPLAIQIEQEHHPQSNPIFTPQDASLIMWNIAKLMVQVADFAVHELKHHLYETHLAMEPFAVALARNMAMGHPISMLLQAHFHGMIFKNAQARHTLIAPGGQVESIIGMSLVDSQNVVRTAAQNYQFDRAALPVFLASHGLDDPAALPGYSYRDDALLIWNAISKYCTDFVGHCYSSDSDVASCDTELQNWLADVRSNNGGRIKGVPDVTTRESLVDVLTQVIFTCSAQHSAVNFSQYDYFAFVPNSPGSAYARPLPSAQSTGVTDLREILPPQDKSLEQTHLMWQLSKYRYDKLGTYEFVTFPPPYSDVVLDFRKALEDIEEVIQTRNETRPGPLRYPYLLPSNIINSISV
jgi:arachidonate 15-lipoxygenase